ncbi:MAG: hypothetical protein Fur0032_05220 [Terrimicrobiaceae bacterium]
MAILAGTSAVYAQPSGGRSQQTAGLAMVKPQVWSKNTEATVMEFSAFEDRTAVGNAAAGYYEFRTKSGQQRQVPAGRVAKLVIYPDSSRIQNLIDSDDRNRLDATRRDLEKTITDFPSTKTYLSPFISGLGEIIGKFDAGQVKVQGVWISRKEYSKVQAAKLATQLKSEIQAANPPGTFDLANDPKYLALQEMARESPEVKKVLNEVLANQQTGARAERRKKIIKELQNPATPAATCRELVKELATLQPSEDLASQEALSKWSRVIDELDKLNESATSLAADLEKSVKDTSGQPGEVVLFRVDTLRKDWHRLRAAPVGRQLFMDPAPAGTVAQVGGVFLDIPALVKNRELFQAKAILDEAAPLASSVGPATADAISANQRDLALKIEKFITARDEGKTHEDAGRTPEAVAKYKEALAIASDPGLAASVERLDGAEKPSAR